MSDRVPVAGVRVMMGEINGGVHPGNLSEVKAQWVILIVRILVLTLSPRPYNTIPALPSHLHTASTKN